MFVDGYPMRKMLFVDVFTKDGCYDACENKSEEARPARSRQDLVEPPLSATIPTLRCFATPTQNDLVVLVVLDSEEILNPSVPMALRLSGILMGPATNKCFGLMLFFLVITRPIRSLTVCSVKNRGRGDRLRAQGEASLWCVTSRPNLQNVSVYNLSLITDLVNLHLCSQTTSPDWW